MRNLRSCQKKRTILLHPEVVYGLKVAARGFTVRSWVRDGRGEYEDSMVDLDRAAALLEEVRAAHPERHALTDEAVRVWRSRCMTAVTRLRDAPRGIELLRAGLAAHPDDPLVARDCAALMTICAALEAMSPDLTPDERTARRDALEEEALDALEAAVDRGYRNGHDLDVAAPFAPLRARERFRELRARVERAGR